MVAAVAAEVAVAAAAAVVKYCGDVAEVVAAVVAAAARGGLHVEYTLRTIVKNIFCEVVGVLHVNFFLRLE